MSNQARVLCCRTRRSKWLPNLLGNGFCALASCNVRHNWGFWGLPFGLCDPQEDAVLGRLHFTETGEVVYLTYGRGPPSTC